jgi:hypothetical protein
MYVCPECRYVEMYAAHLTTELPFASERPIPHRTGRRSVLSALNFQRSVTTALERGAWPFSSALVTSKVRVPGDSGRTQEFDAVISFGDIVYVVEIKSATSPGIIHEAVHEALDRAATFSSTAIALGRSAKPMVIVPAEAQLDADDDIHDVPVLRFDQDTERFMRPLPRSLRLPGAG